MKAKLTFWAFTATAAFLLSPRALARDPKLFPEPQYDPAKVIELEGKVVAVRETPAIDAMAGVHIIVKTIEGAGVDVYLGPTRFVKMLGVKFDPGDQLKLIGSDVAYLGDRVILARVVKLARGPKTDAFSLMFRDEAGEPTWNAFGLN